MEYEYVWLDWREMGERDARRVVEKTRGGRPAVVYATDPASLLSTNGSLDGLVENSDMTQDQMDEVREGLSEVFGDLDRNIDRLTAILDERHVEYEVVRDTFDWMDEIDDQGFSLPPLAVLLPVGLASLAGQRALRAVHQSTGSNDAVELAGRLNASVRSQWGQGVWPRPRDLVHAVARLERRTGRAPVIVTGSVDVLDALSGG